MDRPPDCQFAPARKHRWSCRTGSGHSRTCHLRKAWNFERLKEWKSGLLMKGGSGPQAKANFGPLVEWNFGPQPIRWSQRRSAAAKKMTENHVTSCGRRDSWGPPGPTKL